MITDGTYNYVHFTDTNQVLYMERWNEQEEIPYDDIDTRGLFSATADLFPQFILQEEEEEGGIPINPANFSAKYYKSKKLSRDKIWNDQLIYDRFLDDEDQATDRTILKPIHDGYVDPSSDELTIAQFLTNGYGPDSLDHLLLSNDVNDSIMGNNSDISISLDLFPPNFLPKRNNSNTQRNTSNTQPAQAQTPRVGRARQPSNDRTYQTPISRILRRTFTD